MVHTLDETSYPGDMVNQDEVSNISEKNAPLVLIVDDSTAICNMLYSALELAGYRVNETAGGDGWIQNTMCSIDPPGLVLLDMSDPSKDAVDSLQRLREQWQEAPPILIMTTSNQIYDALHGTERVVHKPFHLHDLLVEIQEILPLAKKKF